MIYYGAAMSKIWVVIEEGDRSLAGYPEPFKFIDRKEALLKAIKLQRQTDRAFYVCTEEEYIEDSK